MSIADGFAEAQRRIAAARESGAETLDLDGLHLDRLPDELGDLVQLQRLGLHMCENLRDVSALTHLVQLQRLYLSGCARLSDVSALARLAQLQTLNLVGCDSVSDVSALAGLVQLQSLGLSWCESLSDVSGLAGLVQLQLLDLQRCAALRSFAPLVPLLDQLSSLFLYGTKFDDLPAEICGETYGENVIEAVRANYRDRAFAETRDPEVKVCILGSSGVGKTQICRRLTGLEFDPSVPTTHGVQLAHLDLTHDEQPVRLNLWDFGGQDIYHGSHALFVHGQAVFVVLWTLQSETRGVGQDGSTIEHRPLSYWLDYLRGLGGTESPVLVVQSHCDRPDQRQEPKIPGNDFRSLRTLSFSAKTDLGLTVLRGELEDATHSVLARKPPIPIGAGRVEVRQQLRKMLEADQKREPSNRKHRTLSVQQFQKLCEQNGKVTSPGALLDYLHRAGVVFYRPGLFDDRIILDQGWALEAIYTLFDPARTLPVFNRHGRFTRRELELLVWRRFSRQEQKLFLSMMESCGICFKVRNLSGDQRKPEWEYLAPELLPEWSDAQKWLLGRMQGGREDVSIKVRYRFLHEGILRAFLSRLGRQAGDAALYWKYGCWFFEKKTESQILIRGQGTQDSGTGTIVLWGVGKRPQELLETVLEELLSIPVGQAPEVSRSWDVASREDADALDVLLQRSKSRAAGSPSETLVVPTHPALPAAAKPTVYISYAWGDDRSDAGRQRGEIVERLCTRLDQWGYDVARDTRCLRSGDWISTFMKAIGRGDHVLAILSEKYFRSPNCMTELFYIYSRSLGEKEEFLKRVIPVTLDDAREIDNWHGRLKYAQYWKTEFQAMEPHLKDLGGPDFERYHLIKQWQAVVGDMLGFIGDKLNPHGFNAIVVDDFAALRQMLPPV